MKLSTILEDAAAGAISAQAIAGNPFTHSSGAVKRRRISKNKVEKLKITESAISTFDVSTAILFEFDGAVGSNGGNGLSADKNEKIVADVNDKVSNATKRAETDDKTQTSTFGLQDGDGKIVKVTVKREQAEDFESRLNSILSDTENKKEIAEVLYMLKQDYDIVDVEWDEPITEDDEEGMGGDEEGGEDDLALDGEGGEEGDLALDGEGEEGELGGEDEASPDMQQSTVQLLQQVIDLLKSETGVRTANADVAKAKAETELQGVEQQKQDNEIAGQQEIADMEDFEEEEKERKKNERLVQRLAKFRSQKSGGASRQ
jgi:hypothetical protein